MTSTQKPHFYMIIHPSLFTFGRPVIPQDFLREYGDSLSSSALLHLPTGAEWRVNLLKLINGEVLIGGGWERFADFYSIGVGHFLLFRYEGSSRFHVLIFDRTASEIEYPYAATTPAYDHSHPEVSVEILDDFPPPQKTSHIEVFDISSSDEILNHNGDRSQLEVEEVQSDFPTTHKTRKTTSNNASSRPTQACSSCSNGNSIPGLRDGALQRAEAFKTQNPFFLVTIQPSYIGTRYRLNVPSKFFQEQFKTGCDSIMLSDSTGRSWFVKCYWGEKYLKFSVGWRNFAQDNSLKVNDVCVFELMKGTEPALKVTIFRNNQNESHHLQQ